MAFSYEEKQGPQHAHLAAIIKDTSYYLNGSIAVMQRLVRDFKLMIRGHSSIGGGIVTCVIFWSLVSIKAYHQRTGFWSPRLQNISCQRYQESSRTSMKSTLCDRIYTCRRLNKTWKLRWLLSSSSNGMVLSTMLLVGCTWLIAFCGILFSRWQKDTFLCLLSKLICLKLAWMNSVVDIFKLLSTIT